MGLESLDQSAGAAHGYGSSSCSVQQGTESLRLHVLYDMGGLFCSDWRVHLHREHALGWEGHGHFKRRLPLSASLTIYLKGYFWIPFPRG